MGIFDICGLIDVYLIVAAFGLEGRGGGLFEYRGQSYSVGGDEGAVTLPNMLSYFSGEPMQGASLGSHFVEVCIGEKFCPGHQYRPSLDQLNGAQSGAWVQVDFMYESYFRICYIRLITLRHK